MKMYRLYCSILLLVCSWSTLSAKNTDSTGHKYLYRVGYDMAKIMQLRDGSYLWQEIQLERINTKNGIMYLELGAGSSKVDNEHLRYNTSGTFVRWGLAQNIVYRASFLDVETASIGFRYGGAWCRNNEVQYTIDNPVYGLNKGSQPARSMYKHWIEVSLGMKYGLTRKWFLGWSLRGAYKLNKPESIKISPYVIPGFGRGDRSSAVNFNIYISYLL